MAGREGCGGSGCPSAAIVAVGVPLADPVVFVVNHMFRISAACFYAPCDNGCFLAAEGTTQPILLALDVVSPPAVSVDGMHKSFCQRRSPSLEIATPDSARELRQPNIALPCRSPRRSVAMWHLPKLARQAKRFPQDELTNLGASTDYLTPAAAQRRRGRPTAPRTPLEPPGI